MDRYRLRARWIVPIDRPPISGGTVTVENGQIVGIHQRAPDSTCQDLGDVALLPGLVNAHTHLEFSDLEQPLGLPGMPLPSWIQQVIADRGRKTRNNAANTQQGLQESLAAGVTTIGDIATAPFLQPAQAPQVLPFQEVIGFSAGRVESAHAELTDRLAASAPGGISPHAPYTVHPQLLERLVDTSVQQQLPLAMHLAESREELELLQQGTGPFRDLLQERSMWDASAIPVGSTPAYYLRVLQRAPRALVVHGNYLSDQEAELLAANRAHMSLIYCPRTHAFFGHEDYPLVKLLAVGVRVALGTDSRASNPDLSVLAELRNVAANHSLPPEDILRLGTLAGAEALGLEQTVGSLSAGKRADMIALPCRTEQPCQELLETDCQPTRVWLAGREMPLS